MPIKETRSVYPVSSHDKARFAPFLQNLFNISTSHSQHLIGSNNFETQSQPIRCQIGNPSGFTYARFPAPWADCLVFTVSSRWLPLKISSSLIDQCNYFVSVLRHPGENSFKTNATLQLPVPQSPAFSLCQMSSLIH